MTLFLFSRGKQGSRLNSTESPRDPMSIQLHHLQLLTGKRFYHGPFPFYRNKGEVVTRGPSDKTHARVSLAAKERSSLLQPLNTLGRRESSWSLHSAPYWSLSCPAPGWALQQPPDASGWLVVFVPKFRYGSLTPPTPSNDFRLWAVIGDR